MKLIKIELTKIDRYVKLKCIRQIHFCIIDPTILILRFTTVLYEIKKKKFSKKTK